MANQTPTEKAVSMAERIEQLEGINATLNDEINKINIKLMRNREASLRKIDQIDSSLKKLIFFTSKYFYLTIYFKIIYNGLYIIMVWAPKSCHNRAGSILMLAFLSSL